MTQSKTASSWNWPKDTEIYRCHEGKREVLREQEQTSSIQKDGGKLYMLSAEFPVYSHDQALTWKLAKYIAREILKTTYVNAVLVKYVKEDAGKSAVVRVYSVMTLPV